MTSTIQYEIYIGCRDSQTAKEIVSIGQLQQLASAYFRKNNVDFSVVKMEGGYKDKKGLYFFENTLCITIIGDQNLDILQLAKTLSMYMNQECFMVTRNSLAVAYQ